MTTLMSKAIQRKYTNVFTSNRDSIAMGTAKNKKNVVVSAATPNARNGF